MIGVRSAIPRKRVLQRRFGSKGLAVCLSAMLLAEVLLLNSQSTSAGEKSELDSKSTEVKIQKDEATVSTSSETSVKKPKRAEVPIELQPYRVQVSITFGSDPLLTMGYRESVLQKIRAAVERILGQMWTLKVEENLWLSPPGMRGLEQLTSESETERFGKASCDKVYIVTVEVLGGRYRISGREWDRSTQVLGRLATRETFQRRTVAADVFTLVHGLFQPIVAIDEADNDTATIRVQAGQFPSVDPDAAQLTTKQFFIPIFRYLDKKKVVRKIQFLPWTYLMVQSVDRARATCSVESGLRAPLGGARRRVEKIAIGIRPSYGATRLILVPRKNPSKPLISHHVNVVMNPPTSSKESIKKQLEIEALHLLTDRSGAVTIPVNFEYPLVKLYVHSGTSLLARVPFVSGVEPEIYLRLPSDSLRLGVEGQLALLEGELVDTVARRATHIALARLYARDGKWEQVDEQIDGFKKVHGIKYFEQQLKAIQFPAVQAAKLQKNRSAEFRIKRLIQRTTDVLGRHLSPDKIRDFENEMDELR